MSIYALTEEMARKWHLYNFFRPQSERRELYNYARIIGMSPSWARRIRDFSIYHFELWCDEFLKSLTNEKLYPACGRSGFLVNKKKE